MVSRPMHEQRPRPRSTTARRSFAEHLDGVVRPVDACTTHAETVDDCGGST